MWIVCLVLTSPLSCCRAASAAWHSSLALAQHFTETLEDDARDSREGQIQRSAFCAQVVLCQLPEKLFGLNSRTCQIFFGTRRTSSPKVHDIIIIHVKHVERLSRYPGQYSVDTGQAKEVMEFKGEQLRVGKSPIIKSG